MIYKGWKITEFRHAGNTWYRADRFGVGMNTNNLKDLKKMINAKNIQMLAPLWRK